MAGTRTLRAGAQAPVQGGVRRRERASARAATGADARGGGSMEAGVDDYAPYDFRMLFKEAGHKGSLSADPSDFSPAGPGKRRKPLACRQWPKR